jgi:hypothetical protein
LKNSTFATFAATGAIVAASVFGGALPASATALGSPSPTPAQKGELYAGQGVLRATDGLQLSRGVIVKAEHMDSAELRVDADHVQTLFARWNAESFGGLAAAMVPIVKDGKYTGYVAVPKIKTGNDDASSPWAECLVVKNGYSQRGQAASRVPFVCETTQRGLVNDWAFTVRAADH